MESATDARRRRRAAGAARRTRAVALGAIIATVSGVIAIDVARAAPLSGRGAAIRRERLHRSGPGSGTHARVETHRGTYHNRLDRARVEDAELEQLKSTHAHGGHAVEDPAEEDPAEAEAEAEDEENEDADEDEEEEEEKEEEKKKDDSAQS